jgi:predicted molibdopterin-dependent oxidoreductase YjgC
MSNAGRTRIREHPVLGPLAEAPECTIIVDSQPLTARVGEPVLAALLANGIQVVRRSEKRNEPRGLFCGIGLCTDCMVTVNGLPNTRSCVTLVEPGMVIGTRKVEP